MILRIIRKMRGKYFLVMLVAVCLLLVAGCEDSEVVEDKVVDDSVEFKIEKKPVEKKPDITEKVDEEPENETYENETYENETYENESVEVVVPSSGGSSSGGGSGGGSSDDSSSDDSSSDDRSSDEEESEPEETVPEDNSTEEETNVTEPEENETSSADVSADYFVSLSGDDSNNGSESSPWRSIQHAVDSVVAGDVVYVLSGTYEEDLNMRSSGSSGNNIVIKGDDVVLSGDIIFRSGASYWELHNFTLHDFSIWGISLYGDNHYITLSDVDVSGGETSVRMTYGGSGDDPNEGPVSHVTITDSVFSSPQYTALDCTPGPCDNMVFRNLEVYGAGIHAGGYYGSDAIAVERGDNILVEDCYTHHNGGDGIDIGSRDFSGYAEGVVVRNNVVEGNRRNGIKIWAGGSVISNVVWDQGSGSVVMGPYSGDYVLKDNIVAYNMYNSSYAGRGYSVSIGYEAIDELPLINLTMRNNTIAFNTGPDVGTSTGIYLGEGVSFSDEGGNTFYSRYDDEIHANFIDGGSEDKEIRQSEITDGTWANLTGFGVGDVVEDPGFSSAWPDFSI